MAKNARNARPHSAKRCDLGEIVEAGDEDTVAPRPARRSRTSASMAEGDTGDQDTDMTPTSLSHGAGVNQRPASQASVSKPGNEVATLATSPMRTSPAARC